MAFACVLGVICFTAAGSRRAAAQGLGLGLRSIRTSARANVNPLISRQMDLRPAIQASVGSKCVPVNSVATICGKMVVLRPPTAVRAEESTVDADKILEDIGSKFNSIENKSQVAIYAGTSIIALLLANGLVTTIDAIPVLPYFMKLVGTGYSTWFIYRYLLFDDSRKELQEDLEAIRKKITGEGME
eukprot:CAMPEP_0184481946 /NCGR_PEP_ID=MMETSP0113_2-20130426/3532_1 /TAXON_ID=91329 /ORGANISM="Norrisiella sphaerica, Strain BC52" /LENGTH=186 /DNA_ID=CAMNT_0026861409 /DNA_START=39 /DNA_END=599 /DNA_ORIENTATION=-